MTPKRAVVVIGTIALLAAVGFGGRMAWRWHSRQPKSTASVKQTIHDYLKEHSHHADFASAYDFELRAKAAVTQTNFAALRDECAALRTNVAAMQRQVAAATRALTAATAEERTARLAAAPARNSGTNETGLAEKKAVWEQRQKDLAAAKEALAARQAEAKALTAKTAEREAAWAAARREFNAKSQELANQATSFSKDIRKAVDEAPSYEAVYAAIGRTLWTADRLLASSDPGDQRQGALLGQEAVGHASRVAENMWLASRIAEAYIWPNLDRYDLAGKKAVAYQALQVSAEAFRTAGETNNLVSNYGYLLKYAVSPRAADANRYYLGYLLEQSGNLSGALENYQAIQDSNYLRYATQRIAVVEQRRGK